MVFGPWTLDLDLGQTVLPDGSVQRPLERHRRTPLDLVAQSIDRSADERHFIIGPGAEANQIQSSQSRGDALDDVAHAARLARCDVHRALNVARHQRRERITHIVHVQEVPDLFAGRAQRRLAGADRAKDGGHEPRWVLARAAEQPEDAAPGGARTRIGGDLLNLAPSVGFGPTVRRGWCDGRSALVAAAVASLVAQQPSGSTVTGQDLLAGLANPARWLTYSGDYSGRRHSPLTQITPANVRRLTAQWTFQAETMALNRGFEATPLAVDGVLYVTGSNNYAWALDGRTGRPFWKYRRELPSNLTYGASAPVNRGFGILGDRLFMVTLDAHLLAMDSRTGQVVWDVVLEDYRTGYSATLAPLIVRDKVIVGISGGEYATRGFIDACDPQTGKRVWRFYTMWSRRGGQSRRGRTSTR